MANRNLNVTDISTVMPDPHTYTIVINERMRRLLHMGLGELDSNVRNECCASDDPVTEDDIEVINSLQDMLDPNGTVGPLVPNGHLRVINSFVL